MVVIDTSVIIDLLRGDRDLTLETLIAGGLAVLPTIVYLELLQGVRKIEERELKIFLETLGPTLPWPDRKTCAFVISKGRSKGIKVGIADILVVADTLIHKGKLMTKDEQLARLAECAGVKRFE